MSGFDSMLRNLAGRRVAAALCDMRRKLRKRAWKWKRQIVVNDQAAKLVNCGTGAVEWQLRWSDVNEITAWKIDLVTTDLICLGFHTSRNPTDFVCDEEQQGWNKICRAVERRFDIDPDWWRQVAFPAFATNPTLLWTGEKSSGA
jgi:hypothetical protein